MPLPAFPTPNKSTNVRTARSTTPFALRATRVGFRWLGWSPKLASYWAERLFLTPRRYARPTWEVDALKTATKSSVPHVLRGEKGAAVLPIWSWSPPPGSWSSVVEGPKTVLLVHGWEGRGSQLAPFVAGLVEQGYRVVTFDAPGHGDAPSGATSVVEHAEALLSVARAIGPVHAVVGHSVGGAATLFATRLGLVAERLVLISPPTSPRDFASVFARTVGIDERVQQAMVARVEERYAIPFAEIDARIDAKRLSVPVLVVHDEGDPIVAVREGRELAGLAPRGTFVLTHGLGHRAILRDREVIATVQRFILGEPRS